MNQEASNITGVKTIAERLKTARKEAKLTQPALAKLAGVSPGTIGNIESGIRKDARELLAIAKAVGVNAEWLKSGKGPKSASPEVLEIAESQIRALLKLRQVPAQETDSAAA